MLRLPLLTLLVLALSAAECWADVIHLNNGRRIRGEVDADESDDQRLVIKVPSGGRLTFPRRMIKKIEKEERGHYLIKQGLNLSGIGSHGEAVACLRQACLETKNSKEAKDALATALVRRGQALVKDKQHASAAKDFAEALEVKPGYGPAQRSLAACKTAATLSTLALSRAKKLAFEGKIDEAIKIYETALKKDPGLSSQIQKPLARLYAKRADKAIESRLAKGQSLELKDAKQSGDDYDRALSLESSLLDEIAPRWSLTRVLQAYYGGAVPAKELANARVLSRKSPDMVTFIRGLEAMQAGQRDQARSHWQKLAPPKTPDQNLRTQALRAALKTFPMSSSSILPGWSKTTGTWAQAKSKHFLVHHQNEMVAKAVLEAAEHHFERIFSEYKKKLSRLDKQRIQIFVHKDRKAYFKAGGPKGSGGVTYTRELKAQVFEIRILVFQSDKQLLSATIPHEMVHALLPVVLGHNKIPHWYHEGLASYFEPAIKQQYYLRNIKQAKLARRLIPAKRILTLAVYPKPDETQVFYASSMVIMKHFVDSKGMDAVLKLGRELLDKKAEDALRSTVGLGHIKDLDKVIEKAGSS